MTRYVSTYVYRVPNNKVELFKKIQSEAAEIYKANGALSDITYSVTDGQDKYGCTGFSTIFSPRESETIFFSITSFKDKNHHDEVMAIVDCDKRIEELYTDIATMLNLKDVVRGEFRSI